MSKKKHTFSKSLYGYCALRASWKPLLCNWLLPGLGYIFLKKKRRAIVSFVVMMLFCFLSYLTLSCGTDAGNVGGIYLPMLFPMRWLSTLGALATIGIGPIYILFVLCFSNINIEPIQNLTQEYGTTYIIIAGLLNWLCLLDIFDRATNRWFWRLPMKDRNNCVDDVNILT